MRRNKDLLIAAVAALAGCIGCALEALRAVPLIGNPERWLMLERATYNAHEQVSVAWLCVAGLFACMAYTLLKLARYRATRDQKRFALRTAHPAQHIKLDLAGYALSQPLRSPQKREAFRKRYGDAPVRPQDPPPSPLRRIPSSASRSLPNRAR